MQSRPEEFLCELSLQPKDFLTGAGERNRTAVISLEGGTHSKEIKGLFAKLRFLRTKRINGLGPSCKTFLLSFLQHFSDSRCPLYLRKRTFALHQPMSAKGHKRTSGGYYFGIG